MSAVWPAAILTKVLDENEKGKPYIEIVPGQGHRFGTSLPCRLLVRRLFLLIALVLAVTSCRTGTSSSARFPRKPLTIMAPANPGGGWDQTARLIQQVLVSEKIVNVPVEVVNRPGAGGTIGLAELVTANRNDPHTIMVLGRVMLGAILTNRSAVSLNETVPLARLLDEYEVIAVPADSKYRTLGELVEDFKKDPQRISWGGGSAGGTDHILAARLAIAAGIDPRHVNYIAHSGGGEAAVAVMGGHVTAGVSGFGEWHPHAQSGRLRYLALSSAERIQGEDVPTIRETGFDVVLANWRSVAAPPGTDPESRAFLVSALEKMRTSASWREILRRNFWKDSFLAGPEFDLYLAAETAENAAMLQAIGLVPRTSLFPLVIGVTWLLSLVWIMAAARRHPAEFIGTVFWSRLAMAAGLLLAYVVLFETMGYVPATTLLIFVTAQILHSRTRWRDLIAGAAISMVLYLVFETLLRKGLPPGWLTLY